MSNLKKAISILKQDGVRELLSNISYRYGYKARTDPRYFETRLKGYNIIYVNSEKVKVKIDNIGCYNEWRFVEGNEKPVINDIMNEANNNDIFLDIGANIGIHSIFAAKVVNSVYSIEPHPVNLSYLSANKDINNSNNITVFSCGFSDKSDYVQIRGPRAQMLVDGSATITENKSEYSISGTYSIKVERGDKFFNKSNLNKPSIIKIDTEGEEFPILKGLKDTIKNNCRLIYCEPHGQDENSIEEFFKQLDYSLSRVGQGRIIKAKRD